jgi:hypothetical protein
VGFVASAASARSHRLATFLDPIEVSPSATTSRTSWVAMPAQPHTCKGIVDLLDASRPAGLSFPLGICGHEIASDLFTLSVVIPSATTFARPSARSRRASDIRASVRRERRVSTEHGQRAQETCPTLATRPATAKGQLRRSRCPSATAQSNGNANSIWRPKLRTVPDASETRRTAAE